jgi:hypothetical protein
MVEEIIQILEVNREVLEDDPQITQLRTQVRGFVECSKRRQLLAVVKSFKPTT